MTKIVCLHGLGFDIFHYLYPGRLCWITCANFLKSGYFPDALPLKQSQWPPIIFAILTQVTRCNYLTAVKIIRKNLSTGKFRANVFKFRYRSVYYLINILLLHALLPFTVDCQKHFGNKKPSMLYNEKFLNKSKLKRYNNTLQITNNKL